MKFFKMLKKFKISIQNLKIKNTAVISPIISSYSDTGSWMRCMELLVELEKDIPGIDRSVLGLLYF